jgi:hypothetical protein
MSPGSFSTEGDPRPHSAAQPPRTRPAMAGAAASQPLPPLSTSLSQPPPLLSPSRVTIPPSQLLGRPPLAIFFSHGRCRRPPRRRRAPLDGISCPPFLLSLSPWASQTLDQDLPESLRPPVMAGWAWCCRRRCLFDAGGARRLCAWCRRVRTLLDIVGRGRARLVVLHRHQASTFDARESWRAPVVAGTTPCGRSRPLFSSRGKPDPCTTGLRVRGGSAAWLPVPATSLSRLATLPALSFSPGPGPSPPLCPVGPLLRLLHRWSPSRRRWLPLPRDFRLAGAVSASLLNSVAVGILDVVPRPPSASSTAPPQAPTPSTAATPPPC